VKRVAQPPTHYEADHAGLERARADRLEAVLAAARRPWLARVLEGLRRKG